MKLFQKVITARRFNKMSGLVLAVLMVFSVVALSGCAPKTGSEATEGNKTEATTEAATQAGAGETLTQPKPEGVPTDRPVATITMADGAKIVIALYPEFAPNTVNNFISLAEAGFYNNLSFHRIINGFMIQGGDPEGTGMGGPGYGIPGEFANNKVQNDLSHLPGVLSMARSGDPNSAGSQFFICHGDASFLDGDYAAFGVVAEGMDAVNDIASVQTGENDKPVTDVIMTSITIERNGYEFDKVVKTGE